MSLGPHKTLFQMLKFKFLNDFHVLQNITPILVFFNHLKNVETNLSLQAVH